MTKTIYGNMALYGSLEILNLRGGGCSLQCDENGDLYTLKNDKLVKYLTQNNYQIGDIFLTTNTDSPASRFGGSWEKLHADAYFKIVTANAGNVGGSPGHMITIDNMPEHTHQQRALYNPQNSLGGYTALPPTAGVNPSDSNSQIWADVSTTGSGGGQAYYPFYYGVFAWIKRSM